MFRFCFYDRCYSYHRNGLHELSRYESSVLEGQPYSEQPQRVNKTYQPPRIVDDSQLAHRRREIVWVVRVVSVPRVRHIVGPANGKCDNFILYVTIYIYT